MVLRSFSTRRLLRPVAALTIAGAGILGFAGAANADSNPILPIPDPGACIGGTTNRSVTVSLRTNADFVTAFRLYVVQGSPTGPDLRMIEREFDGPGTLPFNLELPAGTYWFDWEDRAGDGVTWSGRHSVIPDPFYNNLYRTQSTVTVNECVVETTTTAPPVTTAPPTTAAPTTTVLVNVPTTQASQTTVTPTTVAPSTSVAVNVPTTAVVQTTAKASANTLPATGANSTPLIAAGVAFLGLGAVAVLSTRRRPAAQH